MEQDTTDYNTALLDPQAVFASPEEVVDRPDFTRDQKIEILRRWQYDASEIEVAEEEGMIGGEPSMLRRIVLALETLAGDLDVAQSPPTKQGGV